MAPSKFRSKRIWEIKKKKVEYGIHANRGFDTENPLHYSKVLKFKSPSSYGITFRWIFKEYDVNQIALGQRLPADSRKAAKKIKVTLFRYLTPDVSDEYVANNLQSRQFLCTYQNTRRHIRKTQ
jgi:hypothetical protein